MPVAKTVKSDSDTLAFAKAVTKLGQKQDEFVNVFNEFKDLKAETLTEIQLELKTKRDELDNLDKEYEVKKKDLEIKLDQEIKEASYDKAVEILKEHSEIAVDEDEYNELTEQVETVRTELEEEMENKVTEEKEKAQKDLKQALLNNNLEHKAQIAMITAQVEQLTKERTTYESTISNLKGEIAAQRELTKQVAEAGKQGAISQSFGK